MAEQQTLEHTATHWAAQEHHQHTHAARSVHSGGHHLLQVEDLSIGFTMYDTNAPAFFGAKQQYVPVIHDLHVSVHAGEIVAIVGASGSGKTLLADTIMGIFAPNATVKGHIWFDGVEQDPQSLAALRGHGISLVPQSINYLDPLMKVGRQVRGFTGNGGGDTQKNPAILAKRKTRQQELFARYGLADNVSEQYPFELSGGMARRVLLCCALMDDPQIIIADEPTPGLDLELAQLALADFREYADSGGGVLLITHDIELALQVADRVAVFNDGTVVEETAVANFGSPDTLKHPFSKALWHALPDHDFALPDGSDTTNKAGGGNGVDGVDGVDKVDEVEPIGGDA